MTEDERRINIMYMRKLEIERDEWKKKWRELQDANADLRTRISELERVIVHLMESK